MQSAVHTTISGILGVPFAQPLTTSESGFRLLSSDIPIRSNSRSQRHQEFERKLDHLLNQTAEFGLLGFRATQAEACEKLSNLDPRERFLIKMRFSIEDDPMKRLLLAAVMNAELRRDNQREPHSGTREAQRLYQENFLASMYEVASIFRGLSPAIDSTFNTETQIQVGEPADYFSPNDPLFKRILKQERLFFPRLNKDFLVAWTETLANQVTHGQISFGQAYNIIKDTYLFGAVSGQDVSEVVLDSQSNISTRVLLTGAASLLDQDLQKAIRPELKRYVFSRDPAERIMGFLMCWGSSSASIVNSVLDKALPHPDRVDTTSTKFAELPPIVLDYILLAASFPTHLTCFNSKTFADEINYAFAECFRRHHQHYYDLQTLRRLERLPSVVEFGRHAVDIEFKDEAPVPHATGPKHSLYGRLWGRLDRELQQHLVTREEEKPAAVETLSQESLNGLFMLKRATEVADLVPAGFTQGLLAEEAFLTLSSPKPRMSLISVMAQSALSQHLAKQRMGRF